jgi:hypothetical protein
MRKGVFSSKINWIQIVAAIVWIGAIIGIEIDAETQAQLLAFFGFGQSIVTFVIRTWFTQDPIKA